MHCYSLLLSEFLTLVRERLENIQSLQEGIGAEEDKGQRCGPASDKGEHIGNDQHHQAANLRIENCKGYKKELVNIDT